MKIVDERLRAIKRKLDVDGSEEAAPHKKAPLPAADTTTVPPSQPS